MEPEPFKLQCRTHFRQFGCGCRVSLIKEYCVSCSCAKAHPDLVTHYEHLLANKASIEKVCERIGLEYNRYSPRCISETNGDAIGVAFQCRCVYMVNESAVVDGAVVPTNGKIVLTYSHTCDAHRNYTTKASGAGRAVLVIQSFYCANCVLIYDYVESETGGPMVWKPSTRGHCNIHNAQALIDVKRYEHHKRAEAYKSTPAVAATAATIAADLAADV